MWTSATVLSVFLVAASVCCICSCAECASSGLVCDFKKDCEDGSDEEFCGSCDFEAHSCGWNNTGDQLYTWRRQMANSSVVPGFDHTTGTPTGFVMQIHVKEGASMFPKAVLEFSVNNELGLGCSVSFWYHIYNTDTYSKLNMVMLRGSTVKDLLSISKKNTKGWENATVFIGNQPKGFKLQFVSPRPFMGSNNIKLDDILFNNCAKNDIPPGSDQLSCDFEQDTCSWYHDYSSSLVWTRKSDKAEKPGYHMSIEAKRNLDINSRARLVSFPQSTDQHLCVSFWYHIFGSSIGSLKFITKYPGEEETVVWMRSGTQGNKWRFADLTFRSDKPIQFIIEAVVGGTQGSIAIDDIVVSRSSNGCPAERECTFQGSMCGLQTSAEFGWTRVKGSALPENSAGPKTDHTLGTDQGYYLSSQLWSLTTGAKALVNTTDMGPTVADGECLMFWYHMEGPGVGEINVYVHPNDNTEKLIPVWSRKGDQGSHWRHGRVTLLSPHQQFKVMFEAIAGHNPKGNIAIDDLIVLNDACPPEGFCDFEMDFCGWVNSPLAESGLEWDWLSGSSSGTHVPRRDHSLNSQFGHFAFFEIMKPNQTARLESEMMEKVDRACLELWHYSSDWILQHPSKIILTVLINENDSLRELWSKNGYLNNSWIPGRVDYRAGGRHKIVIEATCPRSNCGSISIDDIHIMRDYSCDGSIPVPTTAAPPPTTTAPASPVDCTFEQGRCTTQT
ncbi:unnamed protein product [Knipowitschia caucasica]